jgi:spore coat-associated protein N
MRKNKEEEKMSIKRKLGMGVASAALGLSLIGGGTWAAFNDTATVNNHFAAGTFNLEVGKANNSTPINFDLTNMKPGDNVQRIFKLKNAGSIAIKEVLLDTTANNFVDGTLPSMQADYLSQFVVDFMQVDSENPSPIFEPRAKVTKTGQTLTLADLVDGSYVAKIKPEYLGTGNKINLAPLTVAPGREAYQGIPVVPEDSDNVFIQITFKSDLTKDGNNEYVQNKYQGDSINFFFNLEATQWNGVSVDTPNGNGAINNQVQGSTAPSPKTSGAGTVPNAVTEMTP